MYFKLAFRNAVRSASDYLLYIFSMVVLTSVMCVSNCLAGWGEVQEGFQTVSLPLLVVIIMAILADCVNTFMIRQRAREFATYMLMGMEKDKLALMILCELSLIGVGCCLLGTSLGTVIYGVCFYELSREAGSGPVFKIMAKSAGRTFVYFGLVELLSILFIKRKIYGLQIVRLMQEKRRNRPMGAKGKGLWGSIFIVSFCGFLLLLSGIAFLPEKVMAVCISVIAVPALLCVYSFYRWLYAFLASVRLAQGEDLYWGMLPYRLAEMTSGSKISAGMNAVFSICLIFSASSFVFGTLLFYQDIAVFERGTQRWMGFLQIGICIIFMTLHFSILSLLQMMDLKREKRDIRLLFHMGKNPFGLKFLLCTQILVKLLLPVLMCFAVVWTAVPFVNHKMNSLLPAPAHNMLLYAACGFMCCFLALYLCYFGVVYVVSTRYIGLAQIRRL